MKISLAFLIPALLISIYCKGQSDSLAQKKQARWRVSLSMGPVGKFSRFEEIPQQDMYSNFNLAGEAQTGFGLNIGCTRMVSKHIGISVSLSGASYAAKKMSTADIFGFYNQFSFGDGTVEESGRWNTGELLAGPLYEYAKGKIRLGAKLMAGAQLALSPDVKLTTTGSNFGLGTINRKFHQPSMQNIAFAYGALCYAGYQLSEKSQLIISAGYSGALHGFDGKSLETESINSFSGSDPYTNSNPIYFKKQISAVSIMLGIARNF
jgi:hypothetical protein